MRMTQLVALFRAAEGDVVIFPPLRGTRRTRRLCAALGAAASYHASGLVLWITAELNVSR